MSLISQNILSLSVFFQVRLGNIKFTVGMADMSSQESQEISSLLCDVVSQQLPIIRTMLALNTKLKYFFQFEIIINVLVWPFLLHLNICVMGPWPS